MENYQPEFNSTVKCGEDVIKEPSVEPAMKEKVEDELSSLKERWLGINKNLDTLMSRYVTTNHLHLLHCRTLRVLCNQNSSLVVYLIALKQLNHNRNLIRITGRFTTIGQVN